MLLSYPDEFGIKKVVSYEIKEKDMDVILDITGSKNIESIPVWKLRGLIRELKETGTNVGSIMTVWYSKLSYGLSLIFLGLLSLFIGKRSDNLPLNLAIGLITIFFVLWTLCDRDHFGKTFSGSSIYRCVWGTYCICLFPDLCLYEK